MALHPISFLNHLYIVAITKDSFSMSKTPQFAIPLNITTIIIQRGFGRCHLPELNYNSNVASWVAKWHCTLPFLNQLFIVQITKDSCSMSKALQ